MLNLAGPDLTPERATLLLTLSLLVPLLRPRRPSAKICVTAAVATGLLIVVFVWNSILNLNYYAGGLHTAIGGDWANLQKAGQAENPFDVRGYRWSPIMAILLRPVSNLEPEAFQLAHFVALPLLGDLPLALIALISWPFYNDVHNGNVLTFILLAGAWAIRGNRVAVVVIFAIAVMIPRPIMFPLTAWFLWKEPWSRRWFAAVFVVHAAAVLASGYTVDWLIRLVITPGEEFASEWNLSPTRWIGYAWVPFGALLALGLWLRGWVGLAGLALSPYVWPYYMLLALLDLPRVWQWVRQELSQHVGITLPNWTGGGLATARVGQSDVTAPMRKPD